MVAGRLADRVRGRATDAARGVYLMRPDGSVLGKISTASGWADAFSATWSPDGRRLAFLADDGDSSLWLVDVTGVNEHKIDEADHLGAPAWAPDGKRLAWTHLPADLSQPAEYRVVDADGNNVRQFPLPAASQVELAWDTDSPFMNWSADGEYLIGVLTPDGANVDRLIQLDPDSGESQIIAAPGLRAWTQQRLAPSEIRWIPLCWAAGGPTRPRSSRSCPTRSRSATRIVAGCSRSPGWRRSCASASSAAR